MAPKTQQVPGTFDVEKRVKMLIPTDVTVGGKTFLVKRSGRVLRQIIALTPDEEFEQNEDGTPKLDDKGEKIPVEDDADVNIRLLYESLSLLFRDPSTGKAPTLESLGINGDDEEIDSFAAWLEDEMDIDVAQELMSDLVPRRAEGNPPGSTSAPAS